MAELQSLRGKAELAGALQDEISKIKEMIQSKAEDLNQKEKECVALRSQYLEQAGLLRAAELDSVSHAKNAADLQQILVDNQLETDVKINDLQNKLSTSPLALKSPPKVSEVSFL